MIDVLLVIVIARNEVTKQSFLNKQKNFFRPSLLSFVRNDRCSFGNSHCEERSDEAIFSLNKGFDSTQALNVIF